VKSVTAATKSGALFFCASAELRVRLVTELCFRLCSNVDRATRLFSA